MDTSNTEIKINHYQKNRFKKFLQHGIIRIFMQSLIWFGVMFLLKVIVLVPLLSVIFADDTIRHNIQGIITLGFMFPTYFYLIKYYEKRPVTELEYKFIIRDSLVGLSIPCAMISSLVIILWFSGYYEIVSINPVTMLITPFIWVPVMATMEEFIFRGILFRILEQTWGTYKALIISALIFGLLHLSNDNANMIMFLSATSGGLMLCMAYVLTKNLWFPIVLHSGWNLVQIFWGTNVSGLDIFGTFINAKIEGPEWLTGGSVGIEGSYLCIVLVALVTLGIYTVARKNNAILV